MLIRAFSVGCLMLWLVMASLSQDADPFLSQFLAIQQEDEIYLRWTIKAGNTCQGTRIERSSDGLEYGKIGEIPGVCGSPDQNISYEFTDTEPLPNTTNYYRLEMGNLGNSSPVSVDFVLLNKEGYLLQPNPVRNRSRLSFENPGGARVEFCLFDTSGRKVLVLLTRSDHVILHRNLLESGTYVFRVTDDGKVLAVGKVVVI